MAPNYIAPPWTRILELCSFKTNCKWQNPWVPNKKYAKKQGHHKKPKPSQSDQGQFRHFILFPTKTHSHHHHTHPKYHHPGTQKKKKKEKRKPIYLHPNSLLFSPFNGVEEATNSDPSSDFILHLLLSLHPDRRIRWPSAGRWEVCSDAGGCSVQDSGFCRPAFWGERVVGLGTRPWRELSKGHEYCAGQWNSYRWFYHFFLNQSCTSLASFVVLCDNKCGECTM